MCVQHQEQLADHITKVLRRARESSATPEGASAQGAALPPRPDMLALVDNVAAAALATARALRSAAVPEPPPTVVDRMVELANELMSDIRPQVPVFLLGSVSVTWCASGPCSCCRSGAPVLRPLRTFVSAWETASRRARWPRWSRGCCKLQPQPHVRGTPCVRVLACQ